MDYFSSFIAIPLSETYKVRFQQMQNWLRELSPHFSLVHHDTPHITLFYIGNCDQLVLDAAADIVRDHIALLLDTSVVLHGLDTFENPHTTVLFLKAQVSPAVYQFAENIKHDFSTVLGLQSLPFKPHLTLTKCATEEAKRDFECFKDKIFTQFKDNMFAFPLNEVVFFAKLSADMSTPFRRVLTLTNTVS